jgi:type IV pilus biogenesis protein CpaD/CtpE
MAENPISKEDIIDSKGILEEIMKVVDALKNQLVPAMVLVEKTALQEKEALNKLNPAQKEDQIAIAQKVQLIQELDSEQKKNKQTLSEIERLEKQVKESMSEEAIEAERLRQQLNENRKANRDLVTSEKTVEGSLTDLRKKLADLKKAYADASPDKRDSILQGVQKLDKEVSKLEKSMGVHQRNVGNYGSALKGLGTKFLALTGITAGFAGAMKLGKEIIESTDALSDKFAATLNGWKEGFGAMTRAIANNDFKDFFKNVKDAVAEGQRFAKTQDAIGDSTRAMKIRISESETEILNLRVIQNSANKTEAERITAGEEIQRILKENAADREKIAKAELDNDLTSAASKTKLSVEIVKAYLDQDEAILKNIAIGEKYIELQKEYENLGGRGKRAGIIMEEIQAMTDHDKASTVLAKGIRNLTDAQKDKITADYEAIESAKQSAINLRVESKLASAEAKTTKPDKSIAESNKKIDEEGIKGSLRNAELWNKIEKDKDKKTEEHNKTRLGLMDLLHSKMNDMNKEAGEAYTEANKNVVENEKKTKEQSKEDIINIEKAKQQAIQDIVGSSFNLVGTMLERSKQKELEAAGDNIKEREKIEKEYAIKQKVRAIAEATINTALAVLNALKTTPFPLGVLLAQVAAAMGAIQIATIIATKFAEGGEVGGKPHSQGGTLIEAEKDEFVIKRKSASKYKGLLKAINDDDPMRIAEELRNKKFHTVWGGVQQTLSNVSKQDPYTRMMYEMMRDKPYVYQDSDGNSVEVRPGYKRTIKRK